MYKFLDEFDPNVSKYFPQALDFNLVDISDVNRFFNYNNVIDYFLEVVNVKGTKTSYEVLASNWRVSYNPDIIENLWNTNHTLIIYNVNINETVRDIAAYIEQKYNVNADAHTFCGKAGSESFTIHKDVSNNIIVQCQGITHWRVFGTNDFALTGKESPVIDVHMTPGDVLIIPKGHYHQAKPLTDRISVSFPFQEIYPPAVTRKINLAFEK